MTPGPIFPRVFGLPFFGTFLVQVCFIAALLGIAHAPMWAGVILCAGAAVFYAARVSEIARLNKLLVLSFLFLLYVSGAWLAYLGI